MQSVSTFAVGLRRYHPKKNSRLTRTALWAFILQSIRRSYWRFVSPMPLQVAVGCTLKWMASCSLLVRQDNGRLLSHLKMEFKEEALLCPSSCSWAHATATSHSRNCNVCFRPVWVDTDYWTAFLLRMIPGSIDGRRWYRLHFAVRVSCLLRLCRIPMRYISHPQRNCYFAVTLPLCCRQCELTLSRQSQGSQ